MNELHEDNILHDALQRSLSGLQGDPALEERILSALRPAGASGTQPRPLRTARLLLIPALLLMLATGALAAERFGLIDLLMKRTNGQLHPSAGQLVAEPAVVYATDTDHAALRVLESLRSGSDVILLIEAIPQAEGTVLVPDDLLVSNSQNNARHAQLGSAQDDEDAVLAHAESSGRQLIALDVNLNAPERLSVSTQPADALSYTILDCTLREDGGTQLLLHLSDEVFATPANNVMLQLRFATTPVERRAEGSVPAYALPTTFRYVSDERRAAFMTLALPAAQQVDPMPTLVSPAPMLLADAGVRIDSLTLACTPLYTRWEVAYTRFDDSPIPADELCFYLCDEQGRRLTASLSGAGGNTSRSGYAGAITDVPGVIHLAVGSLFSRDPLTIAVIPVTAAEP